MTNAQIIHQPTSSKDLLHYNKYYYYTLFVYNIQVFFIQNQINQLRKYPNIPIQTKFHMLISYLSKI